MAVGARARCKTDLFPEGQERRHGIDELKRDEIPLERASAMAQKDMAKMLVSFPCWPRGRAGIKQPQVVCAPTAACSTEMEFGNLAKDTRGTPGWAGGVSHEEGKLFVTGVFPAAFGALAATG